MVELELLEEAAMMPLESIQCSSDYLSIGADFFYFLEDNFPCKGNENEQENFLKKIFDENICKNLDPLPVPDANGEDLRFPLEISDLSYEDRKGIWCIFEYSEDLGNGNLKLPSGKVIEDVEFFGLTDVPGITNKATEEIMARYSRNLAWHERYSAINPLRDYLGKIYEICSGREEKPSGGSHPWFKKDNPFSREDIQNLLTNFSMGIKEC